MYCFRGERLTQINLETVFIVIDTISSERSRINVGFQQVGLYSGLKLAAAISKSQPDSMD
jgi:hypothetical protein